MYASVVIDAVYTIGDLSIFTMKTFSWLFTRFPKRETLLPNFYQVGVLSLPVVALTGTFIGMVLAVQSHYQFAAIGLETRLGAVINGRRRTLVMTGTGLSPAFCPPYNVAGILPAALMILTGMG